MRTTDDELRALLERINSGEDWIPLTMSNLRAIVEELLARRQSEKTYPCELCKTLRTEAEGGKIFTVCDKCWEKEYRKK